ncbi:phospholipase D-like domain-containing protein [Thermofilum sp.]|uniref:phospholipase D-like domain-containing protein n=1 Tax=Thermofilum sp. TaxID=1961369 RepID=UPI00258F01D3|nr:phospholipase D-like domain-containing protein [Thermofilum sp.]
MINHKSLKEELKDKLREILKVSYKPEETIHVEDIRYSLHEMENLINKILSTFNDIKELPENVQQLTDSKLVNETNKACEEIDAIIKDYINKVDDIFISSKVREEFIKQLESIRKFSEDKEKEFDMLRRSLREEMRNFSGRKGENLKKLERYAKELKNNFEELEEKSYELITALERKKALMVSPEILDVVRSLELGGEVWAHEIIEKISGLRNVAGEPYTEEVSMTAPLLTGEETTRLTMDQLLVRYPPFEPIQIESDGIIGRFIWFLESTNMVFIPPKNIQSKVNEYVKIDETSGKLISVKPLDVLKDVQGGEILIILRAGSRKVFIKYGSRDLYNYVQKYGASMKYSIENIQNKYEIRVQKEKRTEKAYSVSNLGYTWYCILGLGMSTDPFDFDCPFVGMCPVGRKSQDKCNKWSWSRRLFPKVYVVPERELALASAADLKYGQPLLFITPFAVSGVRMHELYRRAQWYMPSVAPEGPVVEIHFKKSLKKDLPKTNAIGFEIPLSLVKGIIESLLDEKIRDKQSVIVMHNNYKSSYVGLDKLLLSKFFVYKMTKEGHDTFYFLQMKDDKIMENFENFKEKLQKGYNRDEIVNFAIEIFGHTISHLFHSFISNSLEIEPENLLYVYSIDKKRDALLVSVAENSAWGSLDIAKHAQMKFGSIDRMLEEFVNSITISLEKHEKDIQNYMVKMNNIVTDPTVTKIANELKDRYMSLVSKGLILDTATFLNHIVISGQDIDIAKKLQFDNEREVRERLTDAILASGISTCVDGCSACVMLDHGCTAPLLQNILLSRNLAVWILRVLTGKVSIKGRGNVLGSAIFYQAKESFFAFSPYLDEEGVKVLTDLAQKDVKIILVTHKKFAEEFGEQLKKQGIEVYFTKAPRHDKFYVIDGRVRVGTTQNLSKLSSINEFSLKQLSPFEAESSIRQELEGGAVERY